MLVRLQEGLMRLVSPFSAANDFGVVIHCPEYPEFEGPVVNRLLEKAPYQLSGTVDAEGIMTIAVPESTSVDLRTLTRDHFTCPDGSIRIPTCGPFAISLNVWDLEPATGKSHGINNTVRKMIKSRSGVSIYRDNFRIWPYGERDDDWLELNQRRVNNPTLRVSNNQVIGFVEISHAANPDLRDRTSREGLLDNAAFFDLKALVTVALSLIEMSRFEQRRAFFPSRTNSSGKKEDPILHYMSQLKQSGQSNASNGHVLGELERLYREKAEKDRQRYNQLSRLAGAGMAAEVMTDAFSNEVNRAMTALRILTGRLQQGNDPDLQSALDQLNERMEQVNEQLDLMGPLYRPTIQDSEPITMRGILYDVLKLFSERLHESQTQIEYQGTFDLAIRINRGHLMQVLMILLENSLTIMQEARTINPRIEVCVVAENGFNGIRISDNGPGIASHIRHLIFEPYFSTRQAGRGLGLNVARDILALYTSTLELVETDSSTGACFEIRFDGRRLIKRANIQA